MSISFDGPCRSSNDCEAERPVAVDFFHVDCAVTLKRIYVLFALEVAKEIWLPPYSTEPGSGPSPGASSWPISNNGAPARRSDAAAVCRSRCAPTSGPVGV